VLTTSKDYTFLYDFHAVGVPLLGEMGRQLAADETAQVTNSDVQIDLKKSRRRLLAVYDGD
jgi:hypothetical protein